MIFLKFYFYFNSPAGLQHDVLPHLPIAVLLHNVGEPGQDGVPEHRAGSSFKCSLDRDIDFSLIFRRVTNGVYFLLRG